MDAITLSLSQLAQKELALEVAARGILLAGLVNSPVKGVLALVIGGRSLGRRVLLPLPRLHPAHPAPCPDDMMTGIT